MSNFKAIASQIEKFNGTNWPVWSFQVHAALTYSSAWGIADGTELHPLDLPPAPPRSSLDPAEVTARKSEQASWDKCNLQGKSLLILVVKPSIFQSLNHAKGLRENWFALSTTYGHCTGLNTWVDFRTYIITLFTNSSPISSQINTLSELCTKIIEGGLTVSDQLHALVVLGALPASYETIQSSILGSYTDLTTVTFLDICTCILAEELYQSSSSSLLNAGNNNKRTTRKGSEGKSKDKSNDKCNWCTLKGHWEDECLMKKAGLSKANCKDEEKWRKAVREYAKKNKGNVAAANVSAVINSTGTDGDVVDTQSNEASASFVFYII
jgi:gag-polypeptide of LTR copia-type